MSIDFNESHKNSYMQNENTNKCIHKKKFRTLHLRFPHNDWKSVQYKLNTGMTYHVTVTFKFLTFLKSC